MALKPCRECGHKISTEATACPQCGAKPKQPMGRMKVIALLIFGGFILTSLTRPSSPPKPIPEPPNEFVLAAKARTEARFQSASKVLRSIKAAMREPESVRWQQVTTNDDGTVVCVTYRARNGFGGMNVEHAAFSNNQISTSSTAWNNICTSGYAEEFRPEMFARI